MDVLSGSVITLHDPVLVITAKSSKIVVIGRGKSDVRLGPKLRVDVTEALGKPYGSVFNAVKFDAGSKQHVLEYLGTDVSSVVSSNERDVSDAGAVDNRNLQDDGTSQGLSFQDIEDLKNRGVRDQEMVDTLVSNSKTFNEKTTFSQAKYLKKKQKRYSSRVRFCRPTVRLLWEHVFLFSTGQEQKIGHLRMDTMSQILTASDVQFGSRMILVESCNGLLAGAMLQQMGGSGALVYFHQYSFDLVGAPFKGLTGTMRVPLLAALCPEKLSQIVHEVHSSEVGWVCNPDGELPTRLVQLCEAYPELESEIQKGFEADVTRFCDSENGVQCEGEAVSTEKMTTDSPATVDSASSEVVNTDRMTTDGPAAVDSVANAEKATTDIPPTVDPASNDVSDDDLEMTVIDEVSADAENGAVGVEAAEGTGRTNNGSHSKTAEGRGATKKADLRPSEKAARKLLRLLNWWKTRIELQKNNFDGLVICTHYHPWSFVEKLTPFIALSRPVVIYCQHLEPLVECFDNMRQLQCYTDLRIVEPWMREHQVLPDRSHPHMQMIASGGYLLMATRAASFEFEFESEKQQRPLKPRDIPKQHTVLSLKQLALTGRAIISEKKAKLKEVFGVTELFDAGPTAKHPPMQSKPASEPVSGTATTPGRGDHDKQADPSTDTGLIGETSGKTVTGGVCSEGTKRTQPQGVSAQGATTKDAEPALLQSHVGVGVENTQHMAGQGMKKKQGKAGQAQPQAKPQSQKRQAEDSLSSPAKKKRKKSKKKKASREQPATNSSPGPSVPQMGAAYIQHGSGSVVHTPAAHSGQVGGQSAVKADKSTKRSRNARRRQARKRVQHTSERHVRYQNRPDHRQPIDDGKRQFADYPRSPGLSGHTGQGLLAGYSRGAGDRRERSALVRSSSRSAVRGLPVEYKHSLPEHGDYGQPRLRQHFSPPRDEDRFYQGYALERPRRDHSLEAEQGFYHDYRGGRGGPDDGIPLYSTGPPKDTPRHTTGLYRSREEYGSAAVRDRYPEPARPATLVGPDSVSERSVHFLGVGRGGHSLSQNTGSMYAPAISPGAVRQSSVMSSPYTPSSSNRPLASDLHRLSEPSSMARQHGAELTGGRSVAAAPRYYAEERAQTSSTYTFGRSSAGASSSAGHIYATGLPPASTVSDRYAANSTEFRHAGSPASSAFFPNPSW